MSNSANPNDQWETCPTGQFQQLAADLAARDRWQDRNMLIGRVVTACLLFILVGAVAIWSTRPGHPGAMTCDECCNHFDAYHQQLASGQEVLPDGTFRQVEYHLAHCPSCRSHFSELYPEALASIGLPSCLAVAAPVVAHSAILAALLP